jgi:hypothetical protein
MPTSYCPYPPDQGLWLQARLQEWLPDGHLSYFINDVIEAASTSMAQFDNPGGQTQQKTLDSTSKTPSCNSQSADIA